MNAKAMRAVAESTDSGSLVAAVVVGGLPAALLAASATASAALSASAVDAVAEHPVTAAHPKRPSESAVFNAGGKEGKRQRKPKRGMEEAIRALFPDDPAFKDECNRG